MNRQELFNRLEESMQTIGKGIHGTQTGHSKRSPALDHLLMIIGYKGELSVKQLASILQVTSGAVTQHVDALEKENLVTREINSSDRREVLVKITDDGKKAYQEVRACKSKILSDVFGDLSDDELQTLIGLIEKVSHKYNKD